MGVGQPLLERWAQAGEEYVDQRAAEEPQKDMVLELGLAALG